MRPLVLMLWAAAFIAFFLVTLAILFGVSA